jgi:hypothetical protein
LFAKKNNGPGANPDVVELALDLTAEAIILFERAPGLTIRNYRL